MEDKLIVAVCGFPELYDTSSYLYRDRTKKDMAWRKVSEDVGQPDETDWSSEDGEEEPQGAAAPPPPAPTPPMEKRRAPKRPRGIEKQREVEERLLQALERDTPAPPAPPLSEDELFMRSLVPSLERLPPQQKEYVKFQIHKLIYEASTVVLNLDHLE
ncbi:uncharacterized protein PEZ65_010518 [Lycodopsis pacificus]